MSNINEIPKGSWWYSYINLNTKNFDFLMKILSLWPWSQGHPRGGDDADKNYRPISTIMPNMNEIHQRVFKIRGLINFNAKTLTLTFLWKLEVSEIDPKVTPGVGMVLIKTLDLYLNMQNMNEIHQRVFKIWGLINFNAKTLTRTFLWKFEVCDLDPKVTPGVGMVLI